MEGVSGVGSPEAIWLVERMFVLDIGSTHPFLSYLPPFLSIDLDDKPPGRGFLEQKQGGCKVLRPLVVFFVSFQ